MSVYSFFQRSTLAVPLLLLGLLMTPMAGVAQTPPPIPNAGPKVFLVENGQQSGPFTVDQIKAKIAAREMSRETLAWIDGMPNWAKAGQIPQLAGLFDGTVPPAPPPGRDAVKFLTGRWNGDPQQVAVPGVGTGTARGWTEYDSVGGLKGELITTAPYQGGMMTVTIKQSMQGTYKAEFIAANKIQITLNVSVKSEFSSTGSQVPGAPALDQVNKSFVVTILDDNTARNEQGGISRRAF